MGFYFFTSSSTLNVLHLFNFSYSGGCVVVTQCLFVIWIFSFRMWLFKSHFLSGSFLVICDRVSPNSYTNRWPVICIANILDCVAYLFTLLTVSVNEQTLLILMWSNLSMLSLILICVQVKKSFLYPSIKRIFSYIVFRGFIVLPLISRSNLCQKLIFMMVLGNG